MVSDRLLDFEESLAEEALGSEDDSESRSAFDS
jgi:hypothetical protein